MKLTDLYNRAIQSCSYLSKGNYLKQNLIWSLIRDGLMILVPTGTTVELRTVDHAATIEKINFVQKGPLHKQ